MNSQLIWKAIQDSSVAETKAVSRRIEFLPPAKPCNAFQTASFEENGSSRLPKSNGAARSTKSTSEDQVGLFDPNLVRQYLTWEKVGRVGPGFYNLGNTCFLNSTLQCLLYTPPIAQLMLQRPEIIHASLRNIDDAQPNKTVLQIFCRLVQEVWTYSAKVISPRGMVQNMRRVGKQFRSMRQEDAHEFLRQLLDCMHEELLKLNGVKLSDGKIAETTFISRVFGGYLCNKLVCSRCQYTSKTYNHFQDLSLDIGGVRSVADSIRAFIKPEKLSNGNEWKCDGCKAKVQAEKQLAIAKAPNVLVLSLKRFSCGNFFGKLNKTVTFDLTLDLPCSEEATKTIKFELVGIVVHHGNSVHSGHYVAFVKGSNKQWYEMNDAIVRQVSVQHVLGQQAYILFYARCSLPPLPLPPPPPSCNQRLSNGTVLVAGEEKSNVNSLSLPLKEGKAVSSKKENSSQEDFGEVLKLNDPPAAAELTIKAESEYSAEKSLHEPLSPSETSQLSQFTIYRPTQETRLKLVHFVSSFKWSGPLNHIRLWKANLKKFPLRKIASTLDDKKSSEKESGEAVLNAGRRPAEGPPVQKESAPCDITRDLLFHSRRGRELGGEGAWEGARVAEDDALKALETKRRRSEQKSRAEKRSSEWDQLLDQGRVKKVKTKHALNADGVNPFQQIQNSRRNHTK